MILIGAGNAFESARMKLISMNPDIEIISPAQLKERLNSEQTVPTEFMSPPVIIKPVQEYKYFTPPITRAERRKKNAKADNKTK